MKSHFPVIAAIPNYNMAAGLDRLLPRLLKQGYDAIYVLDDASTDDSASVVAQYPNVKWVHNTVNTGSGGARNLILSALPEVSIIHFLDADVEVKVNNMADTIRRLHFSDHTGFIGGRVLDPYGQQSMWNYGPRLSLAATCSTLAYMLLAKYRLYSFIRRILGAFPNRPLRHHSKKSTQPYWVLESNMMIRSDILKKFGGFDPVLREHDIQPLAARLYDAGYGNGFTDAVTVTQHSDIHVRFYNRMMKVVQSELYMIRRYIGWRAWLFGTRNGRLR